MGNSISSWKIADKVRIVGLTIGLMGATAAHADGITVQQRAQAEMSTGKDYVAAWAAATRAAQSAYSEAQVARARKAARAMNEGKDYHSAWTATSSDTDSPYSPDQIAKARRVQEMLKGKDYQSARETADRVQPTRVPAMGPAPIKTAGREGVGTTK